MNYRKLLFNAVSAFMPFALSAQTGARDSVITNASLSTYSISFDKIAPIVDQYINEHSVEIHSKSQNFDGVRYNVVMTEAQYEEIKKNFDKWKCAVLNSEETTKNLSRSLENQLVEIKKLTSEVDVLAAKISSAQNDSVRWNLEKQYDSKSQYLRDKKRDYSESCASIGTVSLRLDLMRDETSPRQTKVRFVNMPGFEYSYLFISNPKPGFSAKYYNGYNLKYLFTRGKTFVDVGVYKAKDVAETDSTTLTDAFNVAFGQDFYSRHFGRGTRKCFNMYSGYNIGFMAFRGETTSQRTLYVSPTIGVELFKNRYVLWDLRGTYYLPFKNNYDLRGWRLATSFNVAF